MKKKFFFVVYDEKKQNILQKYDLEPHREYTIGRPKSTQAEIIIDGSTSVSRAHAKLIVGENSVSLQDLGSANGTFKNGVQIKPNQIMMLMKGIEIRFADAPSPCEIDYILISDDNDEIKSRSRSRSQEKHKMKNIQQNNLAGSNKQFIKKDNQIWNMGNLNETEKLKMMKLMGVKDTQQQEQADQSKNKSDIQFRNQELEKQFSLAIHQKRKGGGLGM